MSAPSTPRPSDVDGVPVRQLAGAWQDHNTDLTDDRLGNGVLREPARVRASALHALALGAALQQRVESARWVTALDALQTGASVDQLAAALALDAVEVAAGVRSWADGLVRQAAMTPAERDDVERVLADAGVVTPTDWSDR